MTPQTHYKCLQVVQNTFVDVIALLSLVNFYTNGRLDLRSIRYALFTRAVVPGETCGMAAFKHLF